LLIGTAAFVGALLADLIALFLMRAWTRMRGGDPAIVTPAR
jgi:SAM-dependent MidA family methyltransferase